MSLTINLAIAPNPTYEIAHPTTLPTSNETETQMYPSKINPIVLALAISVTSPVSHGQTTTMPSDVTVSPAEAKTLLEAAKSLSLDEKSVLKCSLRYTLGGVVCYVSNPDNINDNKNTSPIVGLTITTRRGLGTYDGCQHGSPGFFDSSIICESDTGKPQLLFELLASNESLKKTVPLLRKQFSDLGKRLNTLHSEKTRLTQKFQGYDLSFLDTIDRDIVQLSKMGYDLAKVTIRFFNAAEPKLIEIEQKRDLLNARQQALAGLRDFSTELDRANQMAATAGSDQSFSEVTAQIDRAVRELERSISQPQQSPNSAPRPTR